jgi:hypothetical protein
MFDSLFVYKFLNAYRIGDAYMVVGGLNDFDDTEEDESESWKQSCVADATCKFALLVREAVQMVPFDEISFVKIR